MQRILTSYSLSYNLKNDRSGHLFQARYKAVLCRDHAYLVSLIRYIHLNPVRAGLVPVPEQWSWSSFRDYDERGRDGLINFDSDLPKLDDERPMEDFEPWPKQGLERIELPCALMRMNPEQSPDLEAIANFTVQGSEITISALRSKTRRREVTHLKRLFIRRAVAGGHSLTSAAHWLGITLSSAQHYDDNNRINRRPDPT